MRGSQISTHHDPLFPDPTLFRSTVVSGVWNFGYGSAASEDTKALGPGSFYTEPAGVDHFARTGSEPVVLYIHGYRSEEHTSELQSLMRISYAVFSLKK